MLSFHVKFVQTDERTDRETTVKQYAPNLSIQGHKKQKRMIKNKERDCGCSDLNSKRSDQKYRTLRTAI